MPAFAGRTLFRPNSSPRRNNLSGRDLQ
jgi:hypothetical protein